MSLVRLLTTGKSLVGQKDSTYRYRMGHPGLLPKFGSQKNPFGKSQATPPTAGQGIVKNDLKAGQAQGSLDPLVVVCGTQEATKVKLAQPCVSKPEPAKSISGPARKALRMPNLAPVWAAARIKTKTLLQTLLRFRRASNPKRPLAVQAELSLDQIKVLRNDLSECESYERAAANTPFKAKMKTRVLPGIAPRAEEAALENKMEMVTAGNS
jgi:hypothetical protein